MQALNQYHWAQDRIQEVTGLTKEQRESQACRRRLKQMAAKREKAERRAANAQAIPNGDG